MINRLLGLCAHDPCMLTRKPHCSAGLPKLLWDASIDLTAASAGPNPREPGRLLHDVRQAVLALPGAGEMSVELHGSAPASLRWLTLYKPGSAISPECPEWDDLHRQVEHAVREVTRVF